eukprot:4548719-Ditylum_brightwellii.AAC.1
MHHCNATERAIHVFKNHLWAGMATCDQKFPLREWDKLLDQAIIMLNLLWTSHINPNLSMHAYIFGSYNFNKCLLVPLGNRVVLHQKPGQRESWEYHGYNTWCIGPSKQHYQCFKYWVLDTGSEADANTLMMIPTTVPIPKFKDKEALEQALSDMIFLIKNPSKNNTPQNWKGDGV